MKIRWLILVLFFPLLSWAQSFNGQITFQELLPYTGSGYPASISRTAYPASMAFPLAPGDAPSSWWNANGTPNGSNQLGLTTATMGQFRCFAWNGDGSCQRVLVNTEITNNFASTKFYTGVSLTLSGSGNFGGSNLAVDNAKILGDGSGCETTGTSSGYICVDTGAIRAQIKKANFDGFNKVVGSDGTVYINGSSDGLTALGPDTTKTMPAAPSTPTASAVSGGSYTASATLYVKAACVGVSGESVASTATAGIAVGSGQLLQVSAPTCDATPDPTGLYNVYVGTSTSPSAMHLQNIRPVTGTWTEPTACPLGGQGCVNGRGISNYLHGTVVYAGNSSGCGSDCTTVYKTASDAASTAAIEENGPVKAAIRVTAALTNGSVSFLTADHIWTFYKGQSFVRGSTLTKNAQDPCPSATASTDSCYSSTHLASDYKGVAAEELRLRPAFTVTNYSFATDTTPVSGTLDAAHDAYLFQGYSSTHQLGESNATTGKSAYCTIITYGCAFPEILRYPSSGGNTAYAQSGYLIQANGSQQAANTSGGSYGMGWADFTGAGGKGIQVGFWSMATEWPKALQAKYLSGTTYDIRLALLPDQTLFDATTAQPYYFAWPQARIADVFINFHSSSLAAPGDEFLKFQYYLVGRATVAAYNRANAFGKVYPLLDPVAVDNYMKGIGAYCPGTAGNCVADKTAGARRVYDWYQAAEGNQNDWDWMFIQEFAERGLTGRLLYAIFDSRYFMTQELPRADGFKWRDRPVGTLTSFGFPDAPVNNGKYLVGNAPLTSRNWNTDPSHSHFYGGQQFLFYFTGNSFLKDALDQAWGDYSLNPNIVSIVMGGQSGSGFGQNRGVGQQVTHRAHYYAYANSQKNTTDAASALSIASTILDTQMPLTLEARGFGSNVKGISPTTGFPAMAQADTTTDATDGPLAASNISSISCDAGGTRATVVLVSNLQVSVNASYFTPPELVRVAGVPSGNFNGDVTLDSITDLQHFSYPAACTASTFCSGAGCGTVNIPGRCPLDTNGSCAAQFYADAFQGPLIAEGLVELAAETESDTSDPNAVWADHTLAEDTALGILRFELYELLPQSGYIGNVYALYRDFYNSDKHYPNHPNCTVNVTYSNWGLWWSLVGTMTAQEKANFESYVSCKWATGYSWEYGSNVAEASIAHMPGFPNASWPTLVDAVHTDTCVASDEDSGSPHCHLSVTVPEGATRYRIKARGDGKSIVDSLNFDNKTDPHADGAGCSGVGRYWSVSYGSSATEDFSGCYGLRPDQNWPFFSSAEVTDLPAPSGTTQDVVVDVSNFADFNSSDLASNKFAVKAVVGGGSIPPEIGKSVLRGGTMKGGVIR